MSIEHPPESFKPEPVSTSLQEHPTHYVPEDINLSRLPYWAGSVKDTMRVLTFKQDIVEAGKTIQLFWQVSPTAGIGLPTQTAMLVHQELLDIAFSDAEGNPLDGEIYFTLGDICRRLGIKSNRDNRALVKKCIKAMGYTWIICDAAYRNPDGELVDLVRREKKGTTLYEDFDFFEGVTDKKGYSKCYIKLADWYVATLNSRKVRPIDKEVCKRLNKAVPRSGILNLYSYLSRMFAGAFMRGWDFVDVPYLELCGAIDKNPTVNLSSAIRQFTKIHSALLEEGFIAEPVDDRAWKGKGKKAAAYAIRYIPGPRAWQEYRQGRSQIANRYQLDLFSKDDALIELPHDLFKALRSLGFEDKDARFILGKYSHNDISLYIEYVDFTHEKIKPIGNKAGYLRTLLSKKSVKPPKGFVSRAELAERKSRQEEAARIAEATRREQDASLAESKKKYSLLINELEGRDDYGEICTALYETMLEEFKGDTFNTNQLVTLRRKDKWPYQNTIYRGRFFEIYEQRIKN